ncbi:MAG: protein kinase [Myxococcales bacterium]|nr:protein kinase [Myxococcales bacterium]
MPKSKPQRFGPYVILDQIGDGGMAEIFLAKMQGYSGFEKLIALKRIHPRYSQNQTFAKMLIHEAKLAASLQHFNVVQVYDLGEIDGQVFVAMEYVKGRDLAGVLSNTYRRKERLPLPLSLCIATEFMTGLDYAHRMRSADGSPLGIIHRDISPQNLLISYEGEVKVTDFGIARVLSEKDGFQLPGNLHGKFGYMSPEQVKGQEIDQRSDIFSAGVVLWEMLTGTRLFRGKEHKETIKMIVSHPIPLPSSKNPEVPPAVDRVVLKALARDPNNRYQTTGALLGELSRVADSLPRRAATRDLSVYMRRQFGAATAGTGAASRTGKRESQSHISHSGFGSLTGISEVSGIALTGGSRMPLGQLLMEQGALSVSELEIALAEQRARGGRIGELLLESGTISEDEILNAISTQANLPTIDDEDLRALPPPQKLLKRFPKEAAEATLILPISVNEEQRSVGLAVADPYDDRAILETKVVLGVSDVVVFVAKRSAIRQAIASWYPEEEVNDPDLEPIFLEPVEASEVLPPVVLFADADTALVEELVARVQEEECEVLVANDGKTARDICRQRQPTVAFLDAALPGIDGYNILLEIRGRNEDAAVFITSSRGDEFRQAKALELGADDFVVKPFSLELTTSKIRRELKKRAGGRHQVAPQPQFAGVSGSLEDMTALDIVQSLELGRKTAHVVLQYEDGRGGELNVATGDLRGCEAGKLLGEEAFYNLMRPGKGLFRIEYRGSSAPENITKPNTFLMIEAMRRLDEGERASRPELEAAPPPEIPTASWSERVEMSVVADDLTLDPPLMRVTHDEISPGMSVVRSPPRPLTMPPLGKTPRPQQLARIPERPEPDIARDLGDALERLVKDQQEEPAPPVAVGGARRVPAGHMPTEHTVKLARVPLRRVSTFEVREADEHTEADD